MNLSLAEADAVADGTLEAALSRALQPMAVCVVDAGGTPLVVKRHDQATALFVAAATGKANTAVQLRVPSRSFAMTAEKEPHLIANAMSIYRGHLVAAAGGVPIVREGVVIGAVGASGDTSDNDEAVAVAGIQAAGLTPGE